MYTLRIATDEDLDFVYTLKELTLKKYIKDIWGWDELYQKNETLCSIRENGTNIILMENKAIGIFETIEDTSKCNIIEIELMPNYQGMGIGTKLITDCIEKSRTSKKSIEIGCFKTNIGAIKLYQKIGFEVYEESETHFMMKLT